MTAITTRLATRRALQERIAELDEEIASMTDLMVAERRARVEAQEELIARDRDLADAGRFEVQRNRQLKASLDAELRDIRGQLEAMALAYQEALRSNRVMRDAMNYVERLAADVCVDEPAAALQEIYEACIAAHFPRRVSL